MTKVVWMTLWRPTISIMLSSIVMKSSGSREQNPFDLRREIGIHSFFMLRLQQGSVGTLLKDCEMDKEFGALIRRRLMG